MAAEPHDPIARDEIALVQEQLRVLATRMRAAWRRAASDVHPELQPLGYTILSTLAHSGPKHAGAIAECLETDKSVVSRQLRSLEELGLVSIAPDPDDGRARIVTATPEAVARIHEKGSGTERHVRSLLTAWPLDDARRLGELLERFNRETDPSAAADVAP